MKLEVTAVTNSIVYVRYADDIEGMVQPANSTQSTQRPSEKTWIFSEGGC